MPRLNKAQRNQAVGMIRAGVSQNEVSRRFGVHRNKISALWRRYQQSGNTRDRRRSGRSRVTSLHQDTYIRVTHLRNRLQIAALTARSIPGLRNISPRTVRNRLREQNIRPRRPAIRPVLQRRHRAGPIFALLDEIGRVSCSQTSHVSTWIAVMVVPGYTVELENGTRITVLLTSSLWRGQYNGMGRNNRKARMPLVVINGNLTGAHYRDEILQAHVVPFVRQHAVTLQHDNARPHVARVVTDFLTQQNVNVLPWPAVSPHLSPIQPRRRWDGRSSTSVAKSASDVGWAFPRVSSHLKRHSSGVFLPILSDPCGGDATHALLLTVDTSDIDFVTWCLRHFWFGEPWWWNGSSFCTFESLELRWNVYYYKSEIYYYCLLRCYYFV